MRHGVVCLTIVAFIVGCGDDSGGTGAGIGELGGPCGVSDACFEGLVCESGTCVRDEIADVGTDGTDVIRDDDVQEDMPSEDTDDDVPDDDIGEDVPPDMPPDPGFDRMETEPNNGENGVDDLDIDVRVRGTLSEPGDADVFNVPTAPGNVYRVELTLTQGSPLQPIVSIIDDGRGRDDAGENHNRNVIGPEPLSPHADFVAMGAGGYLISVRDAGNQGSTEHGYILTVTEQNRDDYLAETFATFPASARDALADNNSVLIYALAVDQGQTLTANLEGGEGMISRMYLFSVARGDWIARSDDEAEPEGATANLDDILTTSGEMFLIVENLAWDAESTAFDLSLELTP